MTDFLTAVVNTPIATILVVAGIGLLFLSLSGKLSAHISVKDEWRRITMVCGFVLLASGIGIQFVDRPLNGTDDNGGQVNNTNGDDEDSPLVNPETAVWLLQFGHFSSRTNAEREKSRLDAAGITNLLVVEQGHFPALTIPGFYVITSPKKQSQIRQFRAEVVDTAGVEGIQYFEKNGYLTR